MEKVFSVGTTVPASRIKSRCKTLLARIDLAYLPDYSEHHQLGRASTAYYES